MEVVNETSELIVHIPLTKHFIESYARSGGLNDVQASRAFHAFERSDAIRRLRCELNLIRLGRVSEKVLADTVGYRRLQQFGSWAIWAEKVHFWLR